MQEGSVDVLYEPRAHGMHSDVDVALYPARHWQSWTDVAPALTVVDPEGHSWHTAPSPKNPCPAGSHVKPSMCQT
eukprot:2804321-Rhodomonas_salina.3